MVRIAMIPTTLRMMSGRRDDEDGFFLNRLIGALCGPAWAVPALASQAIFGMSRSECQGHATWFNGKFSDG